MHTLQVTAKISKTGTITQHDKHMLCLALIKAVMAQPTQTIGGAHVPQLSQQRQSQENPAIASLQCSGFLTQQEALV
ncbi:hypothetical protein UFOVP27_4 [uncultured Caudovirales phage]|uniref:Uncharacterized protein n=1 Tax=uncultured Caudovirales phage TaxID=2100421 RepID=A0A6J5KKW4_9CAUD|nr:hypothetical protein UFOVP27_4 [uncultured Caudovirales phage]